MSEDEGSTSDSSSDESEDINVTGLVATRARRGNAGNLYETLRAHLDDEELQKELLAEDEADDAESYEGSDVEGDDDNDALDSSSDDEDAGPPKEGDAEDLAGEKELLKAERAATSKKRCKAARLTVPAWHKSVKKVKLADEVTADDGSSSSIEPAKKKRKSELGDMGDPAPKRQSSRASAVANRVVTQANLEESAQRARKQKATLSESVKRERANARAELTLEQRLEKCKRIEKETAKELGRFEREEAERVRAREEALMAKRRRHFDGPVIKTLTTSGYYENGKLKVKRLLHGSQTVEEIERSQRADEESLEDTGQPPPAQQKSINEPITQDPNPAADHIKPESTEPVLTSDGQPTEAPQTTDATSQQPDVIKDEILQNGPAAASDGRAVIPEMSTTPTKTMIEHATASDTLDTAAHNGAFQLEPQNITAVPPTLATSNPSDIKAEPPSVISTTPLLQPSTLTQSWASVLSQPFTPIAAALLPPPAPILREQAQRCMVILDSFDSLDGTAKRSKTSSGLEPTPVAQILLPESYPSFTDEQASYLRKARKLKQEMLPKPRCALTTWSGKYKDPKTGVVFADVAAYKMLQRMIAGGCTWNSMLECWTGPAYGQMGRPARGVPDGFDKPVESVKVEGNPA
ncbi:hypothetical protein AMS68_006834 [Peltaster fructicola]|uniref:Uncharacterized protein n=1 Tax=Peltaster fructicola TaxID=286661 RepID=A0A6H0Y2T3_9PEZI|nr:hypothetical protein AMS68_006834 [Peltaster fructicola]